MRDERVRWLQRQRGVTDLPLAGRLLLEKVRAGRLRPETLDLLAAAGDPAARAARGLPPEEDARPLRDWVWGLHPHGRAWVVRALVAGARRALGPLPAPAEHLLAAAEAWSDCPCAAHADAAYLASKIAEPDAGGAALAYHVVLAAHVAGHMQGEPGERSLWSMVGIAIRTARQTTPEPALREAMRAAILARAWASGPD